MTKSALAKVVAKRGRGRPPTHSRAQILTAAKLAFSRSGYANVSLDHLATILKTKKGSIYYHSARKVDLLIWISRSIIASSQRSLSEIARIDAPPEHRFVWAMRAHMSSILSDIQSTKIYFENEADLPMKVRSDLRKVLRKTQEIFSRIIREGCDQGSFSTDPPLAAKHALAVAHWPYRWFSETGKLSREQFIDNAIEFMLTALMAKDRRKIKRLVQFRSPLSVEELTSNGKKLRKAGIR
jgi:AcrR family transcriptional regulator